MTDGEFRMGKISHHPSENAGNFSHQFEVRSFPREVNPLRIPPPPPRYVIPNDPFCKNVTVNPPDSAPASSSSLVWHVMGV